MEPGTVVELQAKFGYPVPWIHIGGVMGVGFRDLDKGHQMTFMCAGQMHDWYADFRTPSVYLCVPRLETTRFKIIRKP